MIKSYIYAAIDIGSNAVRLLINTIYETETITTFNKTCFIRVPIRLGQDAFFKHKISKKNFKKLTEAMVAYNLLMKLYGVQKYRAFATSAMRESINGQKSIKKIKKQSGINIEIISGATEAKLFLNSGIQKILQPDHYYLYVDVGGGSTEITLFINDTILQSRSFPIGTVRLLNKTVEPEYLIETVKPWVMEITKNLHVELIGAGGNINFIFKNSQKAEGKCLSNLYIHKKYQEMVSLSYEERMVTYNMKPDRADVIIPALLIYDSLMKFSHATRIYIPKVGAADGIINLIYQNNKIS